MEPHAKFPTDQWRLRKTELAAAQMADSTSYRAPVAHAFISGVYSDAYTKMADIKRHQYVMPTTRAFILNVLAYLALKEFRNS